MTEGSYKILVVDDEPDLEPLVLQRLRRSIRDGLYEFVFAHNGVEALEKLNDDPGIDMVLSDINMPQMDGLTLLEQVTELNPNIRSVIISAYGDMKNIRTAMNRGAFDFVTKPIDFEDLQVTIARTLKHIVEWKGALASRDQLVALQNELDVASNMQYSILPSDFPDASSYQIYGNMKPAKNVGGVFFDVMALPEGRVGLAIADVSGKGVPAALFMMSSRTLLKGSSLRYPDPGVVLREVNDLLTEDNDAMMFVTLLYGIYDPASGEFTYASGGHNAPLLVHTDGSSELLSLTGGIALGLAPGLEYEHVSVTLAPGDMIFLYTDGVTEAMNINGDQYELQRLSEAFAADPPKDPVSANVTAFESVSAFADDAAQSDDITCLALRRSEAES